MAKKRKKRAAPKKTAKLKVAKKKKAMRAARKKQPSAKGVTTGGSKVDARKSKPVEKAKRETAQKAMVALLDRRRYLSNLVREVTETLGDS